MAVTAMLAMVLVDVVVFFVVRGWRQAERRTCFGIVHAAMRVTVRYAVSRAVQAEEQHGDQDELTDEALHWQMSISLLDRDL